MSAKQKSRSEDLAKQRKRAKEAMRQIQAMRPLNERELHRFVRIHFGLNVVRRAVVAGNSAPFDYLCAAFFGDGERGAKPQAAGGSATPRAAGEPGEPGDLVVWANRGGGKTKLGAVATMLDLIFKPGIQIRILGGSLQQSSRMYEYLRELAQRESCRSLLAKEPTDRELRLSNGSCVRVLAQSSRSVRGEHVHKIRCDEVDDFQESIWSAAQLATRSGWCGEVYVRGRIEALSTMHQPYGPMSKVMAKAAENVGTRVLRWGAMDVMAQCPAERPCEGCALWNDCQGRAKHAEGHIAVDDMIALMRRSSDEVWASEMMCERPTRQALVYGQFDAKPGGRHVTVTTESERRRMPSEAMLIGGMDFGMRNPFVVLWAKVFPPVEGSSQRMEDWTVEVVDELVVQGVTLEQVMARMDQRGWPMPRWIGVDPSGGQRNRQTGVSDIRFMRERGYRIKEKSEPILPGIRVIQRRLDRGTLRIDARCERLIRDLSTYHFDERRPSEANPVKDGADHTCDALRYMLMNLESSGKVEVRMW